MHPQDPESGVLQRLHALERQGRGAKATYMGSGRVLTRANFLELMYFLDASDLLFAPRFIMNGILEEDVSNFFLRKIRPDSRCVDVGANFGYYSCMMAKLAFEGKTIGIEADPKTFALLNDNVVINWLAHIATAVNVAVSDQDGELTLYRRDTRSGNTGIIQFETTTPDRWAGQPPVQFTVPARTLDSLVSEPVDFLKVDVEGAEPLVFRGAQALLERSPSIQIVMEWSPDQIKDAGFEAASFAEALEGYGLSAEVMNYDGTQTPVSWAEIRAHSLCNLLLQRRAGNG